MKKQTSFFLLFIFIFLNAFSQDIERRTLTMGPFYGVKVFSKLDIKLIPSEVNKAIIYGDHKDEVILSLKNKMIKIKLASKSVLNLGYTYIELYHSEPLDRIVAHQGQHLICLNICCFENLFIFDYFLFGVCFCYISMF